LQQAEAARADDADWSAADKNSKAGLQDYLNRHSGGRHAQDARAQLDAIQKRDADAAAAAAAEREKAQKRAAQEQADLQAIRLTLSEFAAAYSRMDARAIAQLHAAPDPETMSAKYFSQFKSIAFQLAPQAAPVVNGDAATVTCIQNVSIVAKSGDRHSSKPDRVRVTLIRAASRWMIRDIVSF
jgi:hypothetical protein